MHTEFLTRSLKGFPLSLLTGLVYKGSSVAPPIPFWVTVCVSLGCVMLVPAYHGVLRLLSK